MIWLTMIEAIAGVATAAFAGIGAYLLITEHLEKVSAKIEFREVDPTAWSAPYDPTPAHPQTKPSRIDVSAVVTNGSRRAVRLKSMTVSGVALEKHDYEDEAFSQPSDETVTKTCDDLIRPGKSLAIGFGVFPSWPEVQRSGSSEVCCSLMIDRRTRVVAIISRTDMYAIPAATIEKNAAMAAKA